MKRVLPSAAILCSVALALGAVLCCGKPLLFHPPPVVTELDAEAARSALVKLLRAKPQAFASPGAAESAEELAAAPIPRECRGAFSVGRFDIDLQARTYSVLHFYGRPGSGFFEEWSWCGRFERDAAGKWRATAPEFTKAWGK